MSPEESSKKEPDLFRETPLRYLGYANEVGEAFRSLVSAKTVRLSYQIAFAYVALDVIDKAKKTRDKLKSEKPLSHANSESTALHTGKVALDCFLWQTFASVLVPGFTINRICKLSNFFMSKSNIRPLVNASRVLTTAIGLGSIPLIIHPIDELVHSAMDKTLRPWLGIEPHSNK